MIPEADGRNEKAARSFVGTRGFLFIRQLRKEAPRGLRRLIL